MSNLIIKDNWKLVLTLIVIAVFAIPLIINIFFKIDFEIELLRAEWTPGDALSFYGIILAAFIGATGVYLSISHSNNNYRDDLRKKALPYFAIYDLRVKQRGILEQLHEIVYKTSESKKTEGFTKYTLTDYSYVLKDGNILLQDGMSEYQKHIACISGVKWTRNESRISLDVSTHVCFTIKFENVGNGAAICFRIGLNREETPLKKKKFSYGFPIKVGNHIFVNIFSENCDKNSPNLGQYILEIYYKDIFGNMYYQHRNIEIGYSNEYKHPTYNFYDDDEQILQEHID